MALITCRDASFAYSGEVVVEGLDFEVNPGDYLCVVGENGSGKSTLIKGLLRLKAAHSGSIVMGDSLSRGEIGYLPQQTAAQKDFPAGAYEVVLSGRLNRRGWKPFYAKADRAAARENMEKLGIWHLRNRCYRELSGGQQQRVLLARALCSTQKLLLLDEPVAGLDPAASRDLYRQLTGLNRDGGLTLVMVSHDIQGVLEYASHILHLQNRQVFFGTVQEYKQFAAPEGFSLFTPETRGKDSGSI